MCQLNRPNQSPQHKSTRTALRQRTELDLEQLLQNKRCVCFAYLQNPNNEEEEEEQEERGGQEDQQAQQDRTEKKERERERHFIRIRVRMGVTLTCCLAEKAAAT